APFCLVSHDYQEKPHFNYGNRCAQKLWELPWDQFVGLPSQASAAPEDRAERSTLLSQVRRNGWAKGYRGLRTSAGGRQFWIENVTVWNLYDIQENFRGQAAIYRDWNHISEE
ncbi:MAG: MEKHLA domain-containing protein, partial [Polyangiaceae bacterium]|nr:MEKHLA domain-containing protein [Polyangiaceae bacterium]